MSAFSLIEENQRAFLLLQILGADDARLMKSEANRGIPRTLKLTTTSANSIRDGLVPHYITCAKEKTPKGGRAIYYRITDEGIAYLLTLKQHAGKLQINGQAINRLVQFLEGDQSFKQAELQGRFRREATSEPTQVSEEDLQNEILAIIGNLKKTTFHHYRYVPVHEVRSAVRRQFGTNAGSHGTFDRLVNNLRRDKRIRTIPINDLSEVSETELQESIPGVNETLFYLEPVS